MSVLRPRIERTVFCFFFSEIFSSVNFCDLRTLRQPRVGASIFPRRELCERQNAHNYVDQTQAENRLISRQHPELHCFLFSFFLLCSKLWCQGDFVFFLLSSDLQGRAVSRIQGSGGERRSGPMRCSVIRPRKGTLHRDSVSFSLCVQ